MLTRMTAILGAICFPAALFADGFTQAGDWQGFIDDDACVIWTVAHSEPNAQMHYRFDKKAGVRLDLGAAAWSDNGTSVKAGSDGFAETSFTSVSSGNIVTADVIPAGHMASLSMIHRPDQLGQVTEILFNSAITGEDIDVSYNGGMTHGRFSTAGFPQMMKEFSSCITELTQ